MQLHLPGSKEAVLPRSCLTRSHRLSVYSFSGTRQMFLQWNKHVWSLFLHFVMIPWENVFENNWERIWKQLNIVMSTLLRPAMTSLWWCWFWHVKTKFLFRYDNVIFKQAAALSWWNLSKTMFKQHFNAMIWTWILLFEHSGSFDNGFKQPYKQV